MASVPKQPEWSHDDDLADEIKLYGDVIVAASLSEKNLSQDEIDKALGVNSDG